jgi:hypothetical protein
MRRCAFIVAALFTMVPLGARGADLVLSWHFGFWLISYIPRWALEDRLVDLTDTIGHFSDLFDPAQLDRAMLLNARTGQRALYGLPMSQISNYIHVWESRLELAGISLDDIPKQWDALLVGPGRGLALRKALGRDDIWGSQYHSSFLTFHLRT